VTYLNTSCVGWRIAEVAGYGVFRYQWGTAQGFLGVCYFD